MAKVLGRKSYDPNWMIKSLTESLTQQVTLNYKWTWKISLKAAFSSENDSLLGIFGPKYSAWGREKYFNGANIYKRLN